MRAADHGTMLVDAELGRGLHGELVAIALRERLHEGDARRRAPPRRATSSTSSSRRRGSVAVDGAAHDASAPVADRDPLAGAHPRDRDRVARLVAVSATAAPAVAPARSSVSSR